MVIKIFCTSKRNNFIFIRYIYIYFFQAANLTEMWIVTNGFDSGVAKYIGDAACDEMARRKSQEEESLEVKNLQVLEKVTKLTILGILAFDSISYSDQLDGQVKFSK